MFKEIVNLINSHGGKAVGLSGKDGDMIRARKISSGKADVDYGHVGEVVSINPALVRTLEAERHAATLKAVNDFLHHDLLQSAAPRYSHSFGATVALRLATLFPDRVRSLTLVEPVFFAAAKAIAQNTHIRRRNGAWGW